MMNWSPEQFGGLARLSEQHERVRQLSDLECDLARFFVSAWHVVEPETPLTPSWHYALICEWLQLISNGDFRRQYPEKLGLIINVPPRTAKSSLVTICWPVWSWLKRPAMRFLCASYASTLSIDHSLKRRNLITSPWFQERWGNRFSLSPDRNRVDDYGNNRTGFHVATSVGGTVTGLGGTVALADDLLSQDDAFSEAARKAACRWVDATWSTKLDNPATGVFVHISQRLAEDDPPGHLLEQQPGKWVHIKVPLEAEQDEQHVFPISGRVYQRPKGDVLQPERFTPVVVEGLKRKSREWAGQYQQQPAPSSGVIFNPDQWKFYRSADLLPSFDIVAISVDCAFKSAVQNDYVCIQKWGSVGPRSYLLECVTQHLGYTATKAAIKAMNNSGIRATVVLIEDKANGSAIIEELKRDDFGASVIAVTPTESKEARAYAASADCEAGNIFLPEDAMWLAEFLRVTASFPGVRHDDIVDACTQFLNWRRTKMPRFGLIEYYERLARHETSSAYQQRHECVDNFGDRLIWEPRLQMWRNTRTNELLREGL